MFRNSDSVWHAIFLLYAHVQVLRIDANKLLDASATNIRTSSPITCTWDALAMPSLNAMPVRSKSDCASVGAFVLRGSIVEHEDVVLAKTQANG
jgi:hypothetical protein